MNDARRAAQQAFSAKLTELQSMFDDLIDLLKGKDAKIEELEMEHEELENDILTLRAQGRELTEVLDD